jgi:NADH dehydrogenase
VQHINYEENYVVCNDFELPYDYLIKATGTVTNYFNTPGSEEFSFSLKNLDEAILLRNHILACFERAVYTDDEEYRKKLLSFVIVGGGPTGIEFSGALSELIKGSLKRDYPYLPIEEIKISLVEASDRLLSVFTPKMSEYTEKTVIRKGATVYTSNAVKEITAQGVTLSDGTVIDSETVIWTAGVQGIKIDSSGELSYSGGNRIEVSQTLQTREYENVYVTGDISHIVDEGEPHPQIAPVATQQGTHAGKNVLRQINGKDPLPFKYRDKGAMATIGRNAAIIRVGKTELKGFKAWVIWIFIHILYLIGFRNKIFVMIHWIWNYFVFDKSIRLILPRCCESPESRFCSNRTCGTTCEN